MAFSCWQALKDNDWTRIPLQAALQHLPPPEKPDPHAPGPFAFADPQRVEGILQSSGYRDIAVQSFAREIRFGEAPTLPESVRKLAMIGPVSRLIAGPGTGATGAGICLNGGSTGALLQRGRPQSPRGHLVCYRDYRLD